MSLKNIIPQRELSEKEILQRDYNLKFKLLHNKMIKNPFSIMEIEIEIRDLLKEFKEKGLFTEKEFKEQNDILDKKITEAFKFIETFKLKGLKERLKAFKEKAKEIKNEVKND